MAAHLLQLTEGSARLLPEMFPQVPHIGRLNLTTDTARQILVAGDVHLGAMAVPYALAVHEDYMKTCLRLLKRGRLPVSKDPDDFKLVDQHEEIERVTGGSFTPSSLQQLHGLRLMRNCTIHSGGRCSRTLINHLASWSSDAEDGWMKVAGRSPRSMSVGDPIEFGHGEVLISLAVTKALARETNRLMQPALPRELWADLVVEDLLDDDPQALATSEALRRARGLARFHYGPLLLTDAEIQQALGRV